MRVSRVALLVVLMSMSAAVFGQSDTEKAFERLKGLAGTWEGTITTVPKFPGGIEGAKTTVTLRVTSMGHTLMHEMVSEGRPDDPITMLYLEDGRIALTHYCDAGNRPKMTAKVSPDGKKVEFSFADISGGMSHGHMHGAVFTFVDDDHHIEEWMFMMPGDKMVHARGELRRVK
jgi:hypothetical protein